MNTRTTMDLSKRQVKALRKHAAFVDHWSRILAEFDLDSATVPQRLHAGATPRQCAKLAMDDLVKGDYPLSQLIAAIHVVRAPVLICPEHGLVDEGTPTPVPVRPPVTHATVQHTAPVYVHAPVAAAVPRDRMRCHGYRMWVSSQPWFIDNWERIATEKINIHPGDVTNYLPAGRSRADEAWALMEKLYGREITEAQIEAWQREFTAIAASAPGSN